MDEKKIEAPDITNVHSLIFGDKNEHITDAVRSEARSIVSGVISEAIHDRERKDQSLSQTIAPLMEDAIAKSIENNKASLISSLYPVVGGLVRKSVSVFFNSFLEKLNYLVEYSLTIKGLKWRIAAWREGIPFAQYMIKRSFVYRVEHVLLIHRPSGNLLMDVASEHSECADPALMSAMLTAIDDFVIDSFNAKDSILDTIKTQDLTLIIDSAPNAVLVAAVSGLPPSDLQQLINQRLEQIHALFLNELVDYQGDNTPFHNVEPHLRSCLVSEATPSQQKKPIYGTLLASALAVLLIATFGYQSYSRQQQLDALTALTPPAGIHIEQAVWQGDSIALTLWRDPFSTSVEEWLTANGIPFEEIQLAETPYLSLSTEIVDAKIEALIAELMLTPRVSYQFGSGNVSLEGNLLAEEANTLVSRLRTIPGVNQVDANLLQLQAINQLDDHQQRQLLFDSYLAKLAVANVDFAVESAELSPTMSSKVKNLAQTISHLDTLAADLDLSFAVILAGYSDSQGVSLQNQALSEERANQVKSQLIAFGVRPELLHSVGIGEIPLTQVKDGSRKVLFSTMVMAPTATTEKNEINGAES